MAVFWIHCVYFVAKKEENQRAAPAAPQQLVRNQRNQRNRVRAAAPAAEVQQDDEDDEGGLNAFESDEKMGAKKRAKLEAKAEKKAHREAELKSREDQKEKDALAEEERKKIEEKEAQEEKRKDDIERKAREEKERQEHEEYLKMKASFAVEEEGFDEEDDSKEELVQNFIDFIKTSKIVVLEDLAAQFKLKTQAAIDRIIELQKDNRLSGVIDDRGKFIYISEEELQAVAKFIRQRGRVSIAELAEHSNSLINLSGAS